MSCTLLMRCVALILKVQFKYLVPCAERVSICASLLKVQGVNSEVIITAALQTPRHYRPLGTTHAPTLHTSSLYTDPGNAHPLGITRKRIRDTSTLKIQRACLLRMESRTDEWRGEWRGGESGRETGVESAS